MLKDFLCLVFSSYVSVTNIARKYQERAHMEGGLVTKVRKSWTGEN